MGDVGGMILCMQVMLRAIVEVIGREEVSCMLV